MVNEWHVKDISDNEYTVRADYMKIEDDKVNFYTMGVLVASFEYVTAAYLSSNVIKWDKLDAD